MKVLITGGAGFIGSHLAERLLGDGNEVAIVDDLNSYYPLPMKIDNLEQVRRRGAVSFHNIDICDDARVGDVFAEARPDVVVHLAARAGVRPSLEQPGLYERVNVGGTVVLLEAARRFGIKHFIFASSSSVYGATNRLPFSEDDHNNLPCSPYAATKLACEKLCFTYSHLYGIRAVCLRFFTVYGPRQRPDLAIRKFTSTILANGLVPMFGDGSTGRDYTYIDDIVDGIVSAIDFDCRYEIFNLGNSYPVRLSKMIETLEAGLGVRAKIERLPDQPGDMAITYADISKAQRLLHYNPSVGFEEGIRRFIAWYLHYDQYSRTQVDSQPAGIHAR